MIATFYMERASDEDSPATTNATATFAPAGLTLVLALTSGAVLLFGVWPGPLLRWLGG